MAISLHVREIRRGPKRDLLSPAEVADILAGRAPLMVRDNIRPDMSAPVMPDGPPEGPGAITWRFFYDGRLDLEFAGDTTEEQVGKHWHVGGIGLDQLKRSKGCTVNAKLIAGQPGTTEAEVTLEYNGEIGSVRFPKCD